MTPEPKFLRLSIHLTEGHFHGIRLGASGSEESDWPPAPSRAFQALVNASLGASLAERADDLASIRGALLWLEQLVPPQVEFPGLSNSKDKESGRSSPVNFQVALPLNNKGKKGLLSHGFQLAPLRRISVFDGGMGDRVFQIHYTWVLDQHDSIPLETLREMAARISYFGRAEDRAAASFECMDELPSPQNGSVVWIPGNSGTRLATPRPYSLQELETRFHLKLPPRVRRPNTSSCFSSQPYRHVDIIEFPQPVKVCVVEVVNTDDDVMAFDCLYADKYRAQVRNAICSLFEKIRWTDKALACELITGHAAGTPSRQPHLAIVPLPSIRRDGVADGQIRRFALLGYSSFENQPPALEIYDTLFRSIGELPMKQDGQPTGCLLRRRPSVNDDKVWATYHSISATWTTVLPVILRSKFDVPASLDGNMRRQRMSLEVTKLIHRALRLQGIPSEVIAATAIQVTHSPMIAKTHRAEAYRHEGSAFRTHVRLSFPCEVQGPVIIGDGRYSGAGLCFPE